MMDPWIRFEKALHTLDDPSPELFRVCFVIWTLLTSVHGRRGRSSVRRQRLYLRNKVRFLSMPPFESVPRPGSSVAQSGRACT